MATLSQFPTFSSLSSHKLFNFPLPFLNVHQHFHIYNHHLHRCRRLSHPPICASSMKKPRDSRKVKSSEDLCNDIREFVCSVGLPEGHVPSLKELSQHGRQDLANVVRRRGYKLIRELLTASTKTDIDGSNTKEGLTDKHYIANANEDESTGQGEKMKVLAEDVSLSSEAPMMEDHSSSINIDSDLYSDEKSCISIESSTKSSLQEKVAKFIQNGELDTTDDGGFEILNETVAEDDEGFVESQNPIELESSSISEQKNNQVLSRTGAAKISNGRCVLSSQQVVPSATENGTSRNDYFFSEGPVSADHNGDMDVETGKKDNQVEINRLKFILHQKELELSQLKQQIEKEKLALSILQTKAEEEMIKAQKLLSVKDAELLAAEETLSDLEEVQIQYWDEGETVEVAGSFNGWDQRIKMDPQPSPSTKDPIGSRKSRLWRTVLWLYPGIYEMKFIVDGQWRIDPQRELVTRGTIHNNILRVNR